MLLSSVLNVQMQLSTVSNSSAFLCSVPAVPVYVIPILVGIFLLGNALGFFLLVRWKKGHCLKGKEGRSWHVTLSPCCCQTACTTPTSKCTAQKKQPVCILIRLSLSNLSFTVSSHPHFRAHLPCLFSSAAVISFMLPYCFQSSFLILSIFFSFTLSLLKSPFPCHHFIRFIIFFL